MAPRQLSPDDQRLSDRAAEAATRSDPDARAAAHRVASRLAWSATDEAGERLERASVLGAFLLLRRDLGYDPPDTEVRKVAEQLMAIHHRHEAIVAANRRDGDGVG